jgi:DeoR family transcriptional regulator, fructose operon transcriptional repressor
VYSRITFTGCQALLCLIIQNAKVSLLKKMCNTTQKCALMLECSCGEEAYGFELASSRGRLVLEGLFVPERWDRIAGLLSVKGRATVEELAEMLSVSAATIRRDLTEMQRRGMLTRTHGGAVRGGQVAYDPSLEESGVHMSTEKESIAQLAASLVEPGDTIMLEGGTTTYEVAQHITASNVTVVTNAANIISVLLNKPDIEIVVVGGILRKPIGTTIGPTAESQLSGLMADKAIIGVNGISASQGLSTPNPFRAQIKKLMLNQAREAIVVADHSKFGAIALCHIAPITAVDKIVTDSKVPADLIDPIIELGVEVLRTS